MFFMCMNAAPWSYTNRVHFVIYCDHIKCKHTPRSEIEFHVDLMWENVMKKGQTSTVCVS